MRRHGTARRRADDQNHRRPKEDLTLGSERNLQPPESFEHLPPVWNSALIRGTAVHARTSRPRRDAVFTMGCLLRKFDVVGLRASVV